MARGSARQRELATRMAMGASRGRLIQQLLVEGLLLGVIGTLAGLAIAPVVSKSLAAMLLGGRDDMLLDTSLDVRVFGSRLSRRLSPRCCLRWLPRSKPLRAT